MLFSPKTLVLMSLLALSTASPSSMLSKRGKIPENGVNCNGVKISRDAIGNALSQGRKMTCRDQTGGPYPHKFSNSAPPLFKGITADLCEYPIDKNGGTWMADPGIEAGKYRVVYRKTGSSTYLGVTYHVGSSVAKQCTVVEAPPPKKPTVTPKPKPTVTPKPKAAARRN